eukprot:g1645.t1
MGKSLNPADAHRRKLKDKAKAKNKKDRKRTREVVAMVKDPDKIMAEIRKLDAEAGEFPDSTARKRRRQLLEIYSSASRKQQEHESAATSGDAGQQVPPAVWKTKRPPLSQHHLSMDRKSISLSLTNAMVLRDQ